MSARAPRLEPLPEGEPVDYGDARGADAAGLAAWLEHTGALETSDRRRRELSPRVRRRLAAWRTGGIADFHSVDRTLCELGLHPLEIPERLWRAEGRAEAGEQARRHARKAA
ncbi:MAG: hypothetical protein LC777_22090 [Actinobacteria bacterium]|nr:hypothetical protein [Actinomycetota bacterium]